MKSIKSKIVMFITGAFVSHDCWDEWRAYFESKGYKTIAQPSPHKDAPANELRRRHPDYAISRITKTAVPPWTTKCLKGAIILC